jgi:hypothetical protein
MTNPLAETTKSGTRALNCPRCGTAFTCNLNGECWCAAETTKLPMPVNDEDCLCQNCLRAEAEKQSAAR